MPAKKSDGGEGTAAGDLVEFDAASLPSRPLFDTGVATRAWSRGPKGETPAEAERRRLCKLLWEALFETKRTVLIAAPTVAEMLRARPVPFDLPRTAFVEVVPFDADAARILGEKLPQDETAALANVVGRSHGCLKYDAMIVACAIRHGADCIVGLDQNTMGKLATKVGVLLRAPKDFLKPVWAAAQLAEPPIPEERKPATPPVEPGQSASD